VTPLIEAGPPSNWQELETRVAQMLQECEYDVETGKNVQLARGDVNIDVWAEDHSSPPNIIAVECKHWQTPVPKNVVHGFRTVVGDSGANTGLIVSSAGFQDGAVEAAAYSNVRLLSWPKFQAMFVEKWFRGYMAPRLQEQVDPLIEYTEPINSRIFRKAEALAPERQEQFARARQKHLHLGLALMPLYLGTALWGEPTAPDLPLRDNLAEDFLEYLPDAVLDAPALRPLLESLTDAYQAAIAQFDGIFGERA
jgi:restriction system protein